MTTFAELLTAFNELHQDAHSGPRDALHAAFCKREPCRRVDDLCWENHSAYYAQDAANAEAETLVAQVESRVFADEP